MALPLNILTQNLQILKKFGIQSGLKTLRTFSTALPNDEENRRKQLMSRGLPKRRPIQGVKHTILVSSGKGGVGKSTIAVNLAAALKVSNPTKNIGILDADIFGPSIPLMMNLSDSPLLSEKNEMIPLFNHGVQCMSMGFLIEEGSPVIWRGLMVMQALEKLLRNVAWDSVEYLIIDTPPGTGDVHLSLIQSIPISGVVLITTPHLAALQVAKRGGVMYQKLDIPIIGIVENMSSIQCPSCSQEIKIFNEATSKLAHEMNCNILASLPLDQLTSETANRGQPIVLLEPNNTISKTYLHLANRIVDFLKKA